ncbi:uncharacterized protein LOC125509291 isoform X2 [Triticum urartu]|uniref:uncharacterized protein LOC125509291 isoform X2 n=1 Tax=Triticum urartu TaxID=4572 RepID=UPI0020443454|nr:uncharacterized protein LOC125509291 isoform X2 [Triticum urartu]
MGTPHSKPAEQTTSSHVPPGPMEGTSVDDSNEGIIPVADDVDKIYPRSPGVHITPSERMILETDGDSTYDTPGPMEGPNGDDSNEGVIPGSDDVHKNYPSSPGVHITHSDRMILEQADCERTYDHQPSHLISDQPSSVDLDEKRELIKARGRAAYRKKKEEATVKQQDENLSALTISDMLNVGWLPLGDITNVCQPTTVDLDDEKEQLKSRRRAAYRKKKEEAASKQKDENLTALTISDGDLIEINVHLQNADQQTSDSVTITDNGVDEQSHESRAAPGRRERACKGGMVAKKRQQKIGKQKKCTQVPHGERNVLRDRRNERFAGRVMTPTVRSIFIPKMSSTGQPIVVEAHGTSTSSSTPEYTIRSEDDMDAYLSHLMNDNVNPDSLFDDEYYIFAGEGSDADDMEHDELETQVTVPMSTMIHWTMSTQTSQTTHTS